MTDEAQIKDLLLDKFHLEATGIERLGGLENANYLLITGSGKFVLKVYPYSSESHALINAENEVLTSLALEQASATQRPVPLVGEELAPVEPIDGQRYIWRLLTFLEGQFLLEVPQTEHLFESLGTTLAHLDRKLLTLRHPLYEGRKLKWDLLHLHLNRDYVQYIPDGRDRAMVQYFFMQFGEQVIPKVAHLRSSLIYNDANEWNILVTDGVVSGLIDFGDMTHSLLINELAVAIAYGCFGKEDPLTWASYVLKAYNKVLPLEDIELEVLYYLVAARLCITIVNAAWAHVEDADNEYAFVSEPYAWELLRRWMKINPLAAENAFREATGSTLIQATETDEMLRKRHQHMSAILSISYQRPIYMRQAALQYMYDAEGNTFLDAYNNIPLVGHCHPKVVEAGQRQMARLNTNTRYLYDEIGDYAEQLLARFPKSLNKVFFVNSGSAATDLALRMALHYSGHKKILALANGYHGNTLAAVDVSHYKFDNPKGPGKKDHILIAPMPDTYRGPHRNDDGTAGQLYAQEAIDVMENAGEHIAAFISEVVLGCGGQVPLANQYLRHLAPAVRSQGGLVILDEVQTGFGRMGDHFWAFEAHGLVPDMVILGKPMGNGHPMGAVVCTEEVAQSFESGVEFFSSFGGNPVSCAIGLSVLKVLEEESLQARAREVGNHYKSLFNALQTIHACVGDVRGSGLFLGVDLIKGDDREPATELASYVKNRLRNRHILISTDGPSDNVIKTKPPLCFRKEDAERVVDEMDQALKGFEKH